MMEQTRYMIKSDDGRYAVQDGTTVYLARDIDTHCQVKLFRERGGAQRCIDGNWVLHDRDKCRPVKVRIVYEEVE